MTPAPEPLDLHHLNLAQAVEVTGKSKSTIKRRKKLLQELGAVCEPSGWILTIEQLVSAGLVDQVSPVNPHATGSNELPAPPVEPPVNTPAEPYEELIKELKTALERERERADRAEQRLELAERRIDRLLPPAPTVKEVEPVESEQEMKRGLFSRWWGR